MDSALLRYFDSAASTPLDPEVVAIMTEHLNLHANNNSKHFDGQKAQCVIDDSLKIIADILGVSWTQLCVMYSGTDANRRFLLEATHLFGKEHIYGSAVEHSSVADEISPTHTFDPITLEGLPTIQNPSPPALNNGGLKEPKVIALMGANSETGMIYPASELRKKYPKALILRDYSQSFAKGIIPDFKNCDAAVFTPQKFYGPKHIGILYLKKPELFPALSKDTHTKAPYLVASTAKAFELWQKEHSIFKNHKKDPLLSVDLKEFQNQKSSLLKISQWDQQICNFIQTHIPDHKFHSPEISNRCPGLINVAFKGVRGSEIMATLSKQEQICISTGSACTSDILVPTPVIQYLEPDSTWQYPIRISLHKFLSDEAVSDFCEILAHYISELRQT